MNARRGKWLDRSTRHDGVEVDCGSKTLEAKRFLSTDPNAMREGWEERKQREWNAAYCNHETWREAIDNGWSIISMLTFRTGHQISFVAACEPASPGYLCRVRAQIEIPPAVARNGPSQPRSGPVRSHLPRTVRPSATYQFDGATHLKIIAGKVTGRWQDNVNSLDGTVSGAITPDGFHILLSGKFFDAKMTVASSPCQQSVIIVLEEGMPIKRLSAVLKKC